MPTPSSSNVTPTRFSRDARMRLSFYKKKYFQWLAPGSMPFPETEISGAAASKMLTAFSHFFDAVVNAHEAVSLHDIACGNTSPVKKGWIHAVEETMQELDGQLHSPIIMGLLTRMQSEATRAAIACKGGDCLRQEMEGKDPWSQTQRKPWTIQRGAKGATHPLPEDIKQLLHETYYKLVNDVFTAFDMLHAAVFDPTMKKDMPAFISQAKARDKDDQRRRWETSEVHASHPNIATVKEMYNAALRFRALPAAVHALSTHPAVEAYCADHSVSEREKIISELISTTTNAAARTAQLCDIPKKIAFAETDKFMFTPLVADMADMLGRRRLLPLLMRDKLRVEQHGLDTVISIPVHPGINGMRGDARYELGEIMRDILVEMLPHGQLLSNISSSTAKGVFTLSITAHACPASCTKEAVEQAFADAMRAAGITSNARTR